MVLPAQQAHKAPLAPPDLRVFKASRVRLDPQVRLDQQVRHQRLLAQLVPRDQQVQVGQTVSLVQPAQLGLRERLALMVRLAQQAQLDLQGQPELVVLLAQRVQLGLVTLA